MKNKMYIWKKKFCRKKNTKMYYLTGDWKWETHSRKHLRIYLLFPTIWKSILASSFNNVLKVCNIKKQPPGVFCKKGVLKNFSKFTGRRLRPEAFNFIKKETLALLLVTYTNICVIYL